MTKSEDDRIVVQIPPGQYAIAVQSVCIGSSLKRMAVAASTVKLDRASSLLSEQYQAQLVATSTSSTMWWLQALDQRLAELRRYHAEQPQQMAQSVAAIADGYDLATTINEWIAAIETTFSIDEVMGKYLDLYESYELLLQINSNNKISVDWLNQLRISVNHQGGSKNFQYIDFLEDLSKGISTIWKEEAKLSTRKKYMRWLVKLKEYLLGYLHRTVPLLDTSSLTIDAEKTFDDVWSRTGGVPGWTSVAPEAALVQSEMQDETAQHFESTGISLLSIDIGAYESAQKLADAVDGTILKAELGRLGLKCGGTVLDRAERLFLLKSVSNLDELPIKCFSKKRKLNSSLESEATLSSVPTSTFANTHRIDIARCEVAVTTLLDHLRPTLEATIRRIERRQTQTLIEREREMEQELYGRVVETAAKEKVDRSKDDDDDEDEEDTPVYNPKNVPLDWDGKPIPYWLFKLHGLNHYYECEICGSESYRGRRAFELHFAEQRHASGMKSLGIPNTKHFHGVTKLDDALELWKQLQEKLQQEQFDGSKDEEYEDSSGNVLSRKTYEDLARQGLL